MKSQLVKDNKLRCPNCEEFHHLFWYVRLEQVQKYAMETNVIYTCPKYKGGCGHVFSPGDHSLFLSLLNPAAPGDRTNGAQPEEAVSEHA